MTKFKSTWAFAIFVIALGAYVFWDFTEQKMQDDLAQDEVYLNEFSTADIKKLTVQKEDNTIELEWVDQDCQILSPIQDRCDTTSVDSLLNALSPLRGRKVMSGSEAQEKQSQFGLANSTKIQWTLKNGSQSSLEIGSVNSFDGGYYVLKADLFVVDRAAGQMTNKGLSELRSKVLWRGPEDLIEVSIQMRESKSSFQLSKVDDEWKVVPESQEFGSDSERIKNWIEGFRNLKGSDVFGEKPAEIKSQPIYTVQAGDQTYDFYAVKEQYFGNRNGSASWIAIPKERLTRVLVPRTYFFDGKKPFQFQLERVSKVEIRNGKTQHDFKKKDQNWVSEEGELKEEKLQSFFQDLKNLEIKTYDVSHSKGFANSKRISLLDSNGQPVFEIQWGDAFKGLGGPFEGDSLLPVRIKNYSGILSVLEPQFKDIVEMDFFNAEKDEVHNDDHVH